MTLLPEFSFTEADIICTDRYLAFARQFPEDFTYLKTDFLYHGPFFWRGQFHPEGPFRPNLIVGHSDYPVTDTHLTSLTFDHLFTINRQTQHPRVHALPLGITNNCADGPLHPVLGDTEMMVEVAQTPAEKHHLAYLNVSVNTYPAERGPVVTRFQGLPWVYGAPVDSTRAGRRRFLQTMRESKFVFCPRGNGLDTCRLWEAMYMGSIPITRYDEAGHGDFRDLPILFVKSWEEVTEAMLERLYPVMMARRWNLDKLKVSYWEGVMAGVLGRS